MADATYNDMGARLRRSGEGFRISSSTMWEQVWAAKGDCGMSLNIRRYYIGQGRDEMRLWMREVLISYVIPVYMSSHVSSDF